MKVFLSPHIGLHSRAMIRVERALHRYKPHDIDIVHNPLDADLIVLHVIGFDSIERAQTYNRPYAAIQYCVKSTEYTSEIEWKPFWDKAQLVWSYYDLSPYVERFYYAPLGVDEVFFHIGTYSPLIGQEFRPRKVKLGLGLKGDERPYVVTSGFVSGPRAEPIFEVWEAAYMCGLDVKHIGPTYVSGIEPSDVSMPHVSCYFDIPDERLAMIYSGARWVSGLRYGEGFELPAAEALACGTLPVVFDQPAMRKWYDGLATFILENTGESLTKDLARVFKSGVECNASRDIIRERFSWETIARGFWERLL